MTLALDLPGAALHTADLIALRPVALAARADPALSDLPGGFVTPRRGHGQEVAELREYVPGDDLRHLDRGSTARSGRPHVRRFHEERDRVCLLVADFRPSMLWGLIRAFRSVAAAEALAMVGWRVVEEGGRVGLLAVGAGDPVMVPVRGRTRGMLAVIGGLVRAHEAAKALAVAGGLDDPPLDLALAPLERIAPRGAELVIASGFETRGGGLADRLAVLARRHVPRLLHLTDGVVARLPRGSYPIRLPDGSRARVDLAGGAAVPDVAAVAGWPALTIDSGAAPEDTARLLAAALPPDRTP